MTTILQQKTIAPGGADWTGIVPFNQFDPSTGDLNAALFTTEGTVYASVLIENLAPVAATVDLSVAASISATTPGIGYLGSVTPTATATVNLGAFDGTLDFAGTSSEQLSDITASATSTVPIAVGQGPSSPL